MSYTQPVAPMPRRETGPRWLPAVAGIATLAISGVIAFGAGLGGASAAPAAVPPPVASASPSASPTTASPTPTPTPAPAETRTLDELWEDGFDAGYAGTTAESKPYWTSDQKAKYTEGYNDGVETVKKAAAEEKLDEDFSDWKSESSDYLMDMSTLAIDTGEALTDMDLVEARSLANDMLNVLDDMEDTQPPKKGKYKTLHKEWNAMIDDTRSGTELLIDGIDTMDADTIRESTSKFEDARGHIEKMTSEMEELNG